MTRLKMYAKINHAETVRITVSGSPALRNRMLSYAKIIVYEGITRIHIGEKDGFT